MKKKDLPESSNGEVVIIDDTPENLHLLNQILVENGYKVRALPNGQMGLSSCQASLPDLVLLDITMPGMDGYEVARQLKADPKTRDVPIIFISAMTRAEDKVKAFESGGVDYVTKPLQVEEVLARVETHLSISRMRDQINQANQKLLAWNMEMAQQGGGVVADSLTISSEMAALFEKPKAELGAGDSIRTTLTVVACADPDLGLRDQVSASIQNHLGGACLASFGGVLVAVTRRDEETVNLWQEERFAAIGPFGHGSGEGEFRVVDDGDGSGLRLDFESPAVLEVLAGLSPSALSA